MTRRTSRSFALSIALAGTLATQLAQATAINFSAAGALSSDIQTTVDAFRAAIGDPNNGNTAGPLASGRREINWDGGGATTPSVVGTPFTGFQNTRGALFTTPGSGFEQAILDDIVNNPSYATTFSTFSASRVFTPVGSNVTDATFFVPGSPSSAVVTAFGAVFSDVDLAGTTRIELFGLGGGPLFSQFVLPGTTASGSLSFLGVQFDGGELITRARITTGNSALGPNDGGGTDLVVMDDFLYSEPQSVPEPGSLSLLAIGAAVALARRKRMSIRIEDVA